MQLILASSSPYRRALLERLRLPFAVLSPGIDEMALPGETGPELARRLATRKATAVGGENPAAVVIGSDQVPTLGDDLLDKPGSAHAAIAQLRASSGRVVEFDTGLCVVAPGHEPLVDCVRTTVHFRHLDEREIRAYVALDQPLDCAGGFKWESLGIALFERLQGDDPTALEGLPLIALCRLLRQVGLDPLAAAN